MLRTPLDDDTSIHNNGNAAVRPCGLRNLGATCYVNSMVQCLFMNLSFRRAVHEWEPKETQRVSPVLLAQMQALQRLFAHMQLGIQSYADPQEFASTLELNNVEFTKLLLTHLQYIFVYSKHRAHWNHIDSHFRGSMHYVTTCGRCNARSSRSSSFFELSYLAPEVLDGDNQYYCDTCQAKQNATRHIEIEESTLPPTLMLHLMRFVYDVKTCTKKKVQDAVEIPAEICMRDLLPSSKVSYRLVGMLNHRGTTASAGHYTAHIFEPSTAAWYLFDDTQVDPVRRPPASFLAASKEAYMLIYSRVPRTQDKPKTDAALPSPVRVAEVQAANAALQQNVTAYAARVGRTEGSHHDDLERSWMCGEYVFSCLVVDLTEAIAVRKAKYEYHMETPLGNAAKFYWIDASVLKAWVLGDDIGHSVAATTSKTTEYVCPHNKLRPDKSRQLKRVSEQLYRELCSVVHAGPSVVLSSENYWCDECVETSASASIVSQCTHDRLKRNLALLTKDSDDQYVISRRWISCWKVCVHHALGLKQPPSKVLDAQDWLASTAINQDLQCDHGNLQPKLKKQVRSISSALWAELAAEYSVSAVFPTQSTVECPDCVADASTQQVAHTHAKNERNQLLSDYPALFRLYKRPLDRVDWVAVNEPVVLMSSAWLDEWKHYIDDVAEDAPSDISSLARCDHGKYTVPSWILEQMDDPIRRQKWPDQLQHGDDEDKKKDMAMVSADEWAELCLVYKAASSAPLSFVMTESQGVQWGVLDADDKHGFVNQPDIRCQLCELKLETAKIALSVDFENQPVTVVVLREEEAIPSTGKQRDDEDELESRAAQRRRSSRSTRRTNPTYRVTCSADDTVSLLKHRILEQCETAPSHQLLYFGGTLLDNATSLKHAGYVIKSTDCLFICVTLVRRIQAHDVVYLKALTDETPSEVLDLVTHDGEDDSQVGFRHSAMSRRGGTATSSWVCDACTFVNESPLHRLAVCEICHSGV
ncbi:hypothetical protein DYB35_000539 [Aphanomyces astaci]|uniref:Ubiquitin carboxyl-terminal hydrolase n=1 Tax=Aphanomyces astaci TaxID=112090 RepID=A0A418DNV4_APHAT|nr:hypothetical protein DYB35_000539 [Aphanomyces astaci]